MPPDPIRPDDWAVNGTRAGCTGKMLSTPVREDNEGRPAQSLAGLYWPSEVGRGSVLVWWSCRC